MRIQTIHVTNFKRFTNLIIKDIPQSAKTVVLVGPNGCGKSSVFDAFEQVGGLIKGNLSRQDDYLRKNPSADWTVEMTDHEDQVYRHNSPGGQDTFCYIRSAYRYSPEIRVSALQTQPEVLKDQDRPKRMIEADSRLGNNYQRLFTTTISDLFSGRLDSISGYEIREKYMREINDVLGRVLDIRISDLGEPTGGRGQLYFSKGSVQKFPYMNLSAGEKEVIDLVLDLVIKSRDFTNSVFCIDEPDLHLNTAIQARLLKELPLLISEQSQLWIATHSFGMIKGAIDAGETAILDFSDQDLDAECTITPVTNHRSTVSSLFRVALEELAELVLEETIIFCEGEDPSCDEKLLSLLFDDVVDVAFVSSTNKSITRLAVKTFMRAVNRGLAPKLGLAIVDMDGLTPEECGDIGSGSLRILRRYSIENYLLDPEVVSLACDIGFDPASYIAFMTERVATRKATIRHKIEESRRREPILRKQLGAHPILQDDIEFNTDQFNEWFPLVPAKLFVGEVLEWIKAEGMSTTITHDSHTNKDSFLEMLASAASRGSSIKDDLSQIIFDKTVSNLTMSEHEDESGAQNV